MNKDDSIANDGSPFGFVTKNLTILLPGLYLLGSTVGMLDSWWFFRQFGINVFLFSDLSDYLLASFREPGAWFIVGLSLLIAMIDRSASRSVGASPKTRRWMRWYGTERYRQIGWIIIFPIVLAYLLIFAGLRADLVVEGRYGRQVEVLLADESEVSATVLGGTIGFLFLYHPDSSMVSVHPYESVITIRAVVEAPTE